MTHPDQKSAFRTRDEQLASLMGVISPRDEYPHVAALLERHLLEAEARGAAEERANVAALEARIAELEGENAELKTPQWFSIDEEGYYTASEALECSGAMEFEVQKISGNREIGVFWAFYDAETVHEYPSEEEAELAARAALKREGGE